MYHCDTHDISVIEGSTKVANVFQIFQILEGVFFFFSFSKSSIDKYTAISLALFFQLPTFGIR